MIGIRTTRMQYLPVAIFFLLVIGSTIQVPSAGGAEHPRARALVHAPSDRLPAVPDAGFIPPARDMLHIMPGRSLRSPATLPSRFDWREHGKVTSVKNQGACGSCYAFAALANVEAKLLVDGEPRYDFSENNIKECEWYQSSCSGGNYHRMANFLSQKGAVLETCDPYVPANVACKSTCNYVTTLLDWSMVSAESIPEPDLLKSYIMAYGPLYTTLSAGGSSWYAELKAYDGSYTLYNPVRQEVNHAVLLIGWDDSLEHAGGQGGWIAKNSWGSAWGGPCGHGSERGFFTMAYGSAMMGCWSSSMTGWQDYDPDGRLLYCDEGGYQAEAQVGFDGVTAWGMCKLAADEDMRIERVEFWATDITTDIDVYIYNDFDGTMLSTLLTSELDQSFSEYGYHSVELASPIVVEPGDDVYAVVRFTNSSFPYPVALDGNGIVAPGKCYVSADGNAWQDVRTIEGCENSDVCIRLRGTELATTHTWHVPSDAATIGEAVGLADAGDTVIVAPGTYSDGSILIDRAIVVMSVAGPESTVIDAGPTGPHEHVILFSSVGSGARLRGFTFTGLINPYASGVVRIANSTPCIEACVIAGNNLMGVGINIDDSSPHISECTIEGNTAIAGVYYTGGSGGELTRTIVSNTHGGDAITCLQGSDPLISCCDLYLNTRSDTVCGTDGGGNFSEDPVFCNGEGGDYSLSDTSPCLAGYGCGRIGAVGQGCPTEIPGALPAFSVSPGDTSNVLEWSLPQAPVQGALIVYSTSAYPESAGAGLPIENGNAGFVMGSPSSQGGFAHTGLSNDTTYYYTAYAYNGTLLSETGLTASGSPSDTVPPGAPVTFSPAPAPGEITLSWVYPADGDLEGVVIRYSTSSYPASHSDGSPVENGAGGVFLGLSGSDDSFTHGGLTDDTVYYYSAFAFDEVPNHSTAAQGSASPGDYTPPDEVVNFTAEAGDTLVHVRWTNPPDGDFEGTLIRYSTATFPVVPTDGNPVENGLSGMFGNAPASQDSFVHMGLTNGEPHYYTAFAFDDRPNYSAGVNASAVPVDVVAPASPQAFTAEPGDAVAMLRWTTAPDADFKSTVIRYSTTSYPASPADGIAVENGSGGVFIDWPATTSTFLHEGLTNNVTYYYAAFSADEVPNYSSQAITSAAPTDTTPPVPVGGFRVVAGDSAVTLTWTNPYETDFAGALLRYSATAYPSSPDDGTPVENGNSGRFQGMPGAAESFTHAGLVNETTYYYSIFAYDEMPNYSAPDTASAAPYDQVPPEFSISVLQNPYITNHLDVFVVMSEVVTEASLRCSVDTVPVELEVTGPSLNVYRGDYDLCTSGVMSISIEGTDLRGNWSRSSRDFSSLLVLAGSGGTAVSPDGRCRVRLEPASIGHDAYVVIFESGCRGGSEPVAYEISPGALDVDDWIEISIEYDTDCFKPEHLCIARVEDARTTPLNSYRHSILHRISAYTRNLGTYMLVRRLHEITPEYGSGKLSLIQNAPNPFDGNTEIDFHLPRPGMIHIDVIAVDGRIVRNLLNRSMLPGRYTVEWDGCDSSGREVASGLYFYRICTAREAVTRKMILLK
ncbi:MAG: C1 family peptidase [Candidatus Eisenbacteria bacterium]